MASHHISAADGMRNVDDLFSHFATTRNKILDHLDTSPKEMLLELWGTYLNRDIFCKRKSKGLCTIQVICSPCRALDRLADVDINVPFMIECGRRAGSYVFLTQRPSEEVPYVSEKLAVETLRLTGKNPLLLECGTPDTTETTFFDVGTTTAEVLVTWLAMIIIPKMINLYTAFHCGSSVYLLKDRHQSLVSLPRSKLTRKTVVSIISQIIMMLKRLSSYDFVHGRSSPKMINYIDKPISQMISSVTDPDETVHIHGDITVGLDIGKYPSITVGTARICPGNRSVSHLSTPSMHPRMTREWITHTSTHKVTLYSIHKDMIKEITNKRCSGIPIYPGSLDLYCILVGLYHQKIFREVIDQEFSHLWTKLWPKDLDRSRLRSRIKIHLDHSFPSYNDIMMVLSGLWLRCDAVDTAWKFLLKTEK